MRLDLIVRDLKRWGKIRRVRFGLAEVKHVGLRMNGCRVCVCGAAVVVTFPKFVHHHNYCYADSKFRPVFQQVWSCRCPRHQQTTTREQSIEKGTNALRGPLGTWCLQQ